MSKIESSTKSTNRKDSTTIGEPKETWEKIGVVDGTERSTFLYWLKRRLNKGKHKNYVKWVKHKIKQNYQREKLPNTEDSKRKQKWNYEESTGQKDSHFFSD